MSIRVKLLALLLAIALPPLVAATWLDEQSTRKLGVELTERARVVMENRSSAQWLAAVKAAANALGLERRLLEDAGNEAAQLLDAAERQLPSGGHVLLVAQGRQGLDVVAERRPDGGVVMRGPLGEAPAALDDDLLNGRNGTRRMRFRGLDSFWVWAPIGDDIKGDGLVVVLPYREVAAEAVRAEAEVASRIGRQRLHAWLILLVLVPVVVGVAIMASRHITRPVNELAAAARRLAGGDFDTRTHITSGDEMEELGAAFNRMVPHLHERMRMRESLALAQEVQRNLLPAAAPEVPGFEVAGISLYCDEIGGDYYDFFLPPGAGGARLAVAVGDVSGHGVAAALLMTAARALLRSRPAEPGRLGKLLGGLNRDLVEQVHAGRFMTLFLAVLTAEGRNIHWVSAGHVPALAYDPAKDSFEEVSGLDIPLGVDPDWCFHELSHSGWATGAVLAIGTDGVWEARAPSGELYGRERLCAAVRAAHRLPAKGILDAVMADMAAFRQHRPLTDDATLVVLKAV
ncbi:MAG: SpoIIE family protein phosphatase [Magnetospirillum sp.]|nr:SpoIIE family protein phosphatase [Magnetospirillum sp.]